MGMLSAVLNHNQPPHVQCPRVGGEGDWWERLCVVRRETSSEEGVEGIPPVNIESCASLML